MESYRFEFFTDFLGEYIHIITFNGNLLEKDVNSILDLCRREYRPNFEEIFKWYLEPLEYSDFKYYKKEISCEELHKRVREIRFNSYEMTEYNNNYFIYFTAIWNEDDYFLKISLIGKKIKDYLKIVYQTEEGDEDYDCGIFKIIEETSTNSNYFDKPYYEDNEESNKPVIRCYSNELFNMLIHIDEINNDTDAQKFCKH